MLGEVLILGAGKTGLAVLEYVASTAPDTASSFTLVGGKEAISLNRLFPTKVEGRIVLGTDTIPNPLLGDKYDVAIVSPGISPRSGLYCAARKKAKKIISEVEFAFLEMPKKWIGITGTNGKTTTATLVRDLLNKLDLHAVAAGNIGLPLIEVAGTYKERLHAIDAAQKRLDAQTFYVFNGIDYEIDAHEITVGVENELPWIVAELSSYQLHNTFDFHPRIACLLNITPDHLTWHGGFENYKQDKARIFQNLTPADFCVVGVDTPDSFDIAQKLWGEGKTVCYVSTAPEKRCTPKEWDALQYRAYLTADKCLQIDFPDYSFNLGPAEKLPIRGEHNVQNILAAATIVVAAARDSLGVHWIENGADGEFFHVAETMKATAASPDSPSVLQAPRKPHGELSLNMFTESLKRALQSCSALPHRIEEVARIHDVAFINDSKATNFDSTLVALRSLEPQKVVLLLGGKDKGIELDKVLLKTIKKDCISVVCFGEAGPRIAGDLEAAFSTKATTAKMLKRADLLKGVPLLKLMPSMKEAAMMAQKIAERYPDHSSVVVLLSPGCSSFDEFSSFEERGTAFKSIVGRLKEYKEHRKK